MVKAKFISKEMTYEQYRKFCNKEHGLNTYMVDYLQGDKSNENKFRALEFLFKPAILQDALKGVDAFQRIGKDLHKYGIGAYKRSPKYFAPILGTVPRRFARRFETPGQKETQTRYRKGITRSRILDLFIDEREEEGYRVMDAWNKSNPDNQIFYEDVGQDAIFDRIQKKYEQSLNP